MFEAKMIFGEEIRSVDVQWWVLTVTSTICSGDNFRLDLLHTCRVMCNKIRNFNILKQLCIQFVSLGFV